MPKTAHYQPAGSPTPALSLVSGRFKTLNAANPTEIEGAGFTVARLAEGQWRVTLQEAYLAINSLAGSVMIASADTEFNNSGDTAIHFAPIEDDTAASSFDCYMTQDGTDADSPDRWVNFTCWCRNTGRQR